MVLSFAGGLGRAKIIRRRSDKGVIKKVFWRRTEKFLPCPSLLILRLSWLRQQQLKLAARRDERNPGKLWRQETGNRVIGELRSLQRGRMRHDGYASDSAVLDDDEDTWLVNSTSGQVKKREEMIIETALEFHFPSNNFIQIKLQRSSRSSFILQQQ